MKFSILLTFSVLLVTSTDTKQSHEIQHTDLNRVQSVGPGLKIIAKPNDEQQRRKSGANWKENNRGCYNHFYNPISLKVMKYCTMDVESRNLKGFTKMDNKDTSLHEGTKFTKLSPEGKDRPINERNPDEYEKLRNEDLLSSKRFPLEDICPFQSIRVQSSEIRSANEDDISCVTTKQNKSECEFIANFVGKPRQFTAKSCPKDSSTVLKPLCSFGKDHRTGPNDVAGLQCNTLPCQPNLIFLGAFNASVGKVLTEEYWPSFNNGKDLERGIANIMRMKYSNQFRFCLLKCATNHFTKATLKQILIFPPILSKSSDARHVSHININIVVEDAVSRAHFYRSLPKTVDTLRHIVHDSSTSATVLDFELYQSYDSSTHSNIQRLFAGAQNRSGISQELSEAIKYLYRKYKDAGYQTMFQEDACWFEGFGSLLRPKTSPGPKNDSFAEWRYFVKNIFLHNQSVFDTFGVGFSSCKILQDLGDANIFNGVALPSLCFNGHHLSSYYLKIVEDFLNLHNKNQLPVFSYVHLNSGHEYTGKRIINDDEYLARFLRNMAKYNNTLSIILSDHGGKTIDYAIETAEGQKEIYKPFLFMIIPHGVAKRLGNERMKHLIKNQKRLIALEDLHLVLVDLVQQPNAHQTNNTRKMSYKSNGLFSEIPAKRNCSDFRLSADTVCLCEGEEVVTEMDDLFLYFLANFVVGEINNLVQSQYMEGKTSQTKHRRCQRYILERVERVRCKVNGGLRLCTFSVVVETVQKGEREEIFEATLSYSLVKRHGINMVKLTRLSRYSGFQSCADSYVDLNLCTCQQGSSHKPEQSSEYIQRIFTYYMFSSTSKIRKLHSSCLYVVLTRKQRTLRNSEGGEETSVYEVINVCDNKLFKVTVSDDSLVRKPFMLSRTLPIEIDVYPNTMHHVVSASCGLPNGMFMANFQVDVKDFT